MELNVDLHHSIQNLENKWHGYTKNGIHTVGTFPNDWEKLYELELLYAEVSSKYHAIEHLRKVKKEELFLQFKNDDTKKTDRIAEAMARTSDEYKTIIEEGRKTEKLYRQLWAKINLYKNKIDFNKSCEISANINKKASMNAGEGQY